MAEAPGNGGGGLPSWVRIITVLGFPVFIAVVLLAAGLGMVDSPLTKIPHLEEKLTALRLELRVHSIETRETTRLLRQICRNIAKSETMATQCEPYIYEPP